MPNDTKVISIDLPIEQFNRIYHSDDSLVQVPIGRAAEPGGRVRIRMADTAVSVCGTVRSSLSSSNGGWLHSINLDLPSRKGRFVLTGGPGFGKSTVIAELGERGFEVFEEAALKVLRRGFMPVSRTLTWEARKEFDREVKRVIERDYRSKGVGKATFYDRGFPDFLGWAEYYGLGIGAALDDVYAHPYENTVFMVPPWREIYRSHRERPFSFEEACEIGNAVRRGYERCGYSIVCLPKTSAATRALVVIDAVKNILGGCRNG